MGLTHSERTGSSLTELASGVDALYLSGRAAPPSALFERLDGLRGAAAELGRAVPANFGGIEFAVAGHGFGKYRYCLRHRYGQVGLTASKALPAVRVQPRSEFLHGAGVLGCVEWFEKALWGVVGPLRFSVSRLDLHADWQGWGLHGDDRGRFVCRAERRDLHEADDEFMGFEFGRRTTGTICSRIYDKTAEQQQKGNDYWHDVWGDRRDPMRPVHRVEFEFGRQGLREFGIDTPREAVEAAGALWASATSEWLTFRTRSGDATRSRWPLAPEWSDVQRASLRGGAEGIERMYAGRRRGQLRRLLPQLNGRVVAFAALVDARSIDEACERLPGFLRDYEVVSRRSFADRVAEKVEEYSVL